VYLWANNQESTSGALSVSNQTVMFAPLPILKVENMYQMNPVSCALTFV